MTLIVTYSLLHVWLQIRHNTSSRELLYTIILDFLRKESIIPINAVDCRTRKSIEAVIGREAPLF